MKNIALHIISTAALLSSFQFSFSQISGAPMAATLACNSEVVSVGGYAQFADKGTTSSCAQADFDSPAAEPGIATVTTIIEAAPCCYTGGNYSALIDNQSIPLKCDRPVSAVLVNGPTLGDVDAAKTVIDITINGKDETAPGAKVPNETVQLRLALVEPISPESAACSVSLIHKGVTYNMVKGDASNVEVTDFVWSMDRKSFILSVQYNCTMRSLDGSADGVNDLHLKGKLLRVHVTNPGAASASE